MDNHSSIIDGLDLGHVTGHLLSMGSLLAVFAGFLPAIAAFGAFIWYCISIYETKTFQAWLHRRRLKRRKH